MTLNNSIISKASSFVSDMFNTRAPSWALYHNFAHTEEVVRVCEQIADAEELNKTEAEIALLAAWFHDVGYIETAEGHEERSVEVAREFLHKEEYPEERIEKVLGSIRATKIPQQPRNHIEEVVCDADIAHIGRKGFFLKSDLMRLEFEKRMNKSFTNAEWLNINIEFLAKHQFHTEYAKDRFQKRRVKHLAALHDQLREELDDRIELSEKKQNQQKKEEKKRQKELRPERGIETMFRTVPKNHLELSAMADHKANLLLSTSSIIISLVVSLLVRRLGEFPMFMIPTVMLLGVCVVTIIYAILVTRPKVNTGTFTREDIQAKKVNLLFFGNFHKATLEEFQWGMNEMMRDKDYLYGAMIKDLYFLGKVLGTKYKYLRICYNVFLYGILISVLAFVVAIMFEPPAG